LRWRSSVQTAIAMAHGTVAQNTLRCTVASQSVISGAMSTALHAHDVPEASRRANGRNSSGTKTGNSIRPATQRNGPCASKPCVFAKPAS